MLAEMKPKHFDREVRRARHLSAWIKVEGRAHCECQVMDISKHGAKVIVALPSAIPDRFELAFSKVVKIEFARSFGAAPRCLASSSSFE
jgi:hypothetical protein